MKTEDHWFGLLIRDAKSNIFNHVPLFGYINTFGTYNANRVKANIRIMRRSVSLIVVLMVLAMTLMPGLVNGRVLASQEKTTHEPFKDQLHFPTSIMKEKANTEDNISTRVLIGSEVNTMSSGPSRRGSGH